MYPIKPSRPIRTMRPINVPSRQKPTASVGRAIACLLICSALGAAGIAALSRKATKPFYFQATCSDLRLSSGLVLRIDPLVDSFHLTNFRGTIGHINQITTPRKQWSGMQQGQIALSFQSDRQDTTNAPPSLRFQRMGHPAPAAIGAQGQVSLHSAVSSDGKDRTDLTVGAQTTLLMQAEKYSLEAVRYKVTGIPDPTLGSLGNDMNFEVSSSALLEAKFESPSEENTESGSISLIYPESAGKLFLLDTRLVPNITECQIDLIDDRSSLDERVGGRKRVQNCDVA